MLYFFEGVCKTPIGIYWQTVNAIILVQICMLSKNKTKQNQGLWEPLVQDPSIVDGERKTPLPPTVVDQLEAPGDTVGGLET